MKIAVALSHCSDQITLYEIEAINCTGYIETFNGKLRDELLNCEVFYTLTEAKVLTEQWRKKYNQVRPHSSLGYQPPVPEARIPVTLT